MLATVPEATLEELIEAQGSARSEIASDLLGLSPEVFFAPQGEHWSPAEHIDHLTRCDQALLRGLRLPRFLLRLRFGRAGGVSRPNDELVGEYLDKLAAGAGARGRYRPELPPPEERTDARQRQLLTGYRWLDEVLGGKIFFWRWLEEEEEGVFDRYRLPHPLLGPLTIREMLAWSLYHNRHHHRRILERLTEGDPMSGCKAIHTADDIYVELGPEAPRDLRRSDYGSYIIGVWSEVAALGRRLGLGDLDAFVCPEDDYMDIEEVRAKADEAEEEGHERFAALLRKAIAERLPSHDPKVVLEVVRGLIAHLEREPEGDLAEVGLNDLRAYEFALSRCAADERRVFITPY